MSNQLVSIGFPVRNGEHRVRPVVTSVLAQDHSNLEIVISDNASSDGTEALCHELAASDPRVVYHRQAENVGLMNNFVTTMRLARGDYFRWIGADDSLAPTFVSRCLEVLEADERLLLVTSQIAYELDDGSTVTSPYAGPDMGSPDPAERFAGMLRLMTEHFTLIDPLYAMMRRSRVVGIPRRNMLKEDEVFAAKLSVAGPWGHVPEVLATRGWSFAPAADVAKKLDVPRWNAWVSWLLQSRELLEVIRESELDRAQRGRARSAVFRLYVTRHRKRVGRLRRKLSRRTSSETSSGG